MKTSLSQISPKLFDLYYRLELAEGELTPELEKELEITQEEFGSVIEDYSLIVDQYTSEVEKSKQYILSLESRVKTLENKKSYFIDLLTNAIKSFGVKGVTSKGIPNYKVALGDFGEISLTPSQSLEIEDESKIPDKFKVKKASIDAITDEDQAKLFKLFKDNLDIKESVKKNDIKEALKNEESVDGVKIVTNYRVAKKIKAAKL